METRMKFLRIALVAIGLFFIIGIYPMMNWWWTSGWSWLPRQSEYEQMILGVYATLGVFLILAAKNPLENRSLIWFTVWSSVVHAAIMLIQALVDPQEHPNLLGDIPALFLVALVLGSLMPRKVQ